MSKLRPCATFQADFPDDQIEEDGQIIRFGGQGVTQAIASIMTHAGYSVSSPLEYRGEMGWAFDVDANPGSIEILVSPQTERDYILISTWKSARARHAAILTTLNVGLAQDTRFISVRWFLNNEIGSRFPGAETPVSDEAPRPARSRSAGWIKKLMTRLLRTSPTQED
jgi:hypothetical protein